MSSTKYVAIRQQRTCRIATIWQATSLPSALTAMLETISGLSQFIQQRHTPDNVRRLLKTSKSKIQQSSAIKLPYIVLNIKLEYNLILFLPLHEWNKSVNIRNLNI